ncbi:tetratricopeptide repeat protein [Candidatus Foliamicus sp.]
MRAAAVLALGLLAAGCQAGLTANQQAAALNLELGASYLRQGRLELARDKLLRASRQDPRSAEAHRVLGMAYERLGDASGAEQHYGQAVRLAPRDVEALNSFGVFRCRQPGTNRQGLRLLRRAAENAPPDRRASVYANGGLCALAGGGGDAAEWLRRALELDPGQNHARMLLERLETGN